MWFEIDDLTKRESSLSLSAAAAANHVPLLLLLLHI
jgi:hypothetical protein